MDEFAHEKVSPGFRALKVLVHVHDSPYAQCDRETESAFLESKSLGNLGGQDAKTTNYTFGCCTRNESVSSNMRTSKYVTKNINYTSSARTSRGRKFQRKKYKSKKEFAYRMRARRPTSAMPKPFLCCERAFCCSMVVM